jgi:hypothetical protein
MSLLGQSLTASEDSVLAQARTLSVPGTAREVWDTEEPEGVDLTFDKFGGFAPYHALSFGGPVRSLKDRSLNGSATDPHIVTVAIGSYAKNTTELRTIHGEILDKLAGFYPTDSGELVLEGGFNMSFASNNVRPTIYGRVTFGTYMTNIKGA